MASGGWTRIGSEAREFFPSVFLVVATYAGRGRSKQRPSLVSTLLQAVDLLAHFDHRRGKALAWNSRYERATSQQKRVLTELLGLGIAAHSALLYGWDPRSHHLFSFDDLNKVEPERRRQLAPWNPPGTKPDILFETPAGMRSIEARGRTNRGTIARRPTSPQRDRLSELAGWATAVASRIGHLPAWGMAWSEIRPEGTVTDLFDPGEPVALTSQMEISLQLLGDEIEAGWAHDPAVGGLVKHLRVSDHFESTYECVVAEAPAEVSGISYVAVCAPTKGAGRILGASGLERIDDEVGWMPEFFTTGSALLEITVHRGITFVAAFGTPQALETAEQDLEAGLNSIIRRRSL